MSAFYEDGFGFSTQEDKSNFIAKKEARKKVVEDVFNRPGRAATVLTGQDAFKPASPGTALTGITPDKSNGLQLPGSK